MTNLDRVFLASALVSIAIMIFILMVMVASLALDLNGWEPVMQNYKAQEQQLFNHNPKGEN